MTKIKKPALAIVGIDESDTCANSTYTRLRKKVLEPYFEVTIFNLPTAVIKKRDMISKADALINSICDQLPQFDMVNIDCELGLYGDTIKESRERLYKLIRASNRLVFTMHKIDVDKVNSYDFSILYAQIVKTLRDRPRDQPYHIFVHMPKERRALGEQYGIYNVLDYPVCYLDKDLKRKISSQAMPGRWRKKNGFKEGDILIGIFGILSGYKDYATVIRALKLLPDNYKLVFVGGEHDVPLLRGDDTQVRERIAYIESLLENCPSKLEERIHFLGRQNSNDHFYEAMASIDFVVVSHFEGGQSASGVTSLALEFGKKVITTRNSNFIEYNKFCYQDCFEMFDPSNYFELKHKILYFDKSCSKNLEVQKDKYTPEGLAKEYKLVYDLMLSNEYNNNFTQGVLEAFLESSQSNSYAGLNRKICRMLRWGAPFFPKPVTKTVKRILKIK